MAAFAARRGDYSTSAFLAGAIYNAATDGTDRLRYVVGPDAEAMLAARGQLSDEAYVAMVSQRMGL